MIGIVTLNKNTSSVEYLCQRDKRFAKVVDMVGEITYKPYEDTYKFLVSQIVGQMLSNKVARCIMDRLEQICCPITPDLILALSTEDLRAIGISYRKIEYIKNLSNAVKSGELCLEAIQSMTDNEAMKTLTSIKGLGNWSAKMFLIFALNRQDILPYEDMAFIQAYRWLYKTDDVSQASVEKKCKKWKPYSSIAARYFYKAHDMGLTKMEFHLYK